MRRVTIIAIAVLLIVVAGIGAVMGSHVLEAGAAPPPPLPTPVAAVAGQWTGPIMLPTTVPPCLAYASNGATIAPDNEAGSGWALMIRLEGAEAPDCAAWSSAVVMIEEGNSLASLSGQVTTVSANRLEFARLAETDAAGRTHLTLQWRCREIMCRVDTTLDGPLTEPVLLDIAASFQPART